MKRFHGIARSIRDFLDDTRGGMAILAGAVLVIGCGLSAFAVDMGHLYLLRGRLQATADAAALAGVGQLPNTAAVSTVAIEYAGKNMPAATHGTVLVAGDVVTGNWDSVTRTFTPAGTPINAVRVITRKAEANGNPEELFFARVLGFQETNISVTAIAAVRNPPVCILALQPVGAGAITFQGDETITTTNCGIQVNSTDPNAAVEVLPSSPNVTVDSFCISGGISGPTGGFSPLPETGCSPIPDPFVNVDPPPVGACDFSGTTISGGAVNLLPGVYCGGLTVKANATVTFSPGVYIIKDGQFSVDGTSSVIGAGVTFYLTGNASAFVNLNKDSQVNLSAPTTGPLAGLVIFEERNVANPRTHFIGSNDNLVFEGALYLPQGTAKIVSRIGSGPSPSPHTVIVARKFRFSTAASLHMNGNFAGSSVPAPLAVRGQAVLVK